MSEYSLERRTESSRDEPVGCDGCARYRAGVSQTYSARAERRRAAEPEVVPRIITSSVPERGQRILLLRRGIWLT